ncbi:Rare lipoprotein A (RlpA)-like double-psi beta-barrel [Cohaesibacter sp. ES.047]|uniref:septal ring lytic transglycosylase RlpA family protein n=1 Tax=Cohaesibacter sp. ES.047 TaxID=1798205 RepID=UPI000BB69460|nr:septal ring lytic transglycosylase RlpA family protein [Cohaesibacter sp. ES.047]SNY93453.1 Rare lipoprotein A (RlpA)-like double-psi beta-barrel [Cohaesibacter sp. ES.047]
MSLRFFAIAALSVSLVACSGTTSKNKKGRYDPKYGVSASTRVATDKSHFKKGGGHYKIGRPYKVAGRTYVPKHQPNYEKTGKASWYGDDFHGRLTANGEIFNMNELTAAHPTLPLPSYVRVTNLKNGRSVIVRVNDRGPYAHNRVIDLSKRVAEVLSFKNDGIANVRVKYVGKARMDGKDARYLEASYRAPGQKIGDDRRAVPAEGQDRAAPEVMVASAAPAKKKPSKQRGTFLLAHLPNLGEPDAPKTSLSFPTPVQLAEAPENGWAPIDLVGDGYFPPDEANPAAPINFAQIAPVQLNYAEQSSQRVRRAHEAIAMLFDTPKQNALQQALKRKKTSGKKPAPSVATNRIIGSLEPAYARRIAEEFAALAAVDLSAEGSGLVSLRITRLKSGVLWSDIDQLKEKFGLKSS